MFRTTNGLDGDKTLQIYVNPSVPIMLSYTLSIERTLFVFSSEANAIGEILFLLTLSILAKLKDATDSLDSKSLINAADALLEISQFCNVIEIRFMHVNYCKLCVVSRFLDKSKCLKSPFVTS